MVQIIFALIQCTAYAKFPKSDQIPDAVERQQMITGSHLFIVTRKRSTDSKKHVGTVAAAGVAAKTNGVSECK